MVVYIEYAFLENFLLDFTLLFLSLKASREKVRLGRLLFASVLGGVFAVIFPTIPINQGGRYALKWLTGFLLCFVAFGELKTKKAWGRYALNCIFFFASTFFLGGALTALNTERSAVFFNFVWLSAFFLILVRLLYKKQAVARFLYDCKVRIGDAEACVQGFYDTGNLATFAQVPVCFLSPEYAYLAMDSYGEHISKNSKKMTVSTVSGEKELTLFLGEVEIENGKNSEKKQVYFAMFGNSVNREYKLILHSEIFR